MIVEFSRPTLDDALATAQSAIDLSRRVSQIWRDNPVVTGEFLDAVKQAQEACLFAQLTCDWAAQVT
jgi:hypothetical protein